MLFLWQRKTKVEIYTIPWGAPKGYPQRWLVLTGRKQHSQFGGVLGADGDSIETVRNVDLRQVYRSELGIRFLDTL